MSETVSSPKRTRSKLVSCCCPACCGKLWDNVEKHAIVRRYDDSGNLLNMFDDVSSVEDGDIEENSECNGEDNSLLAPHGWQWRYCTSLDNFDSRASTCLFVAQHTSIFYREA